MSAKKNKRKLQSGKKRAKSADSYKFCGDNTNSVHPSAAGISSNISAHDHTADKKTWRKPIARSSPFFPCFSRNESEENDSDRECQQQRLLLSTVGVLRSSSANSILSTAEADLIGSDLDFNFEDDPPSELTLQRLNQEPLVSPEGCPASKQVGSSQPKNQHSSFFQVAKEISTKLASTVAAAVATATRSNTSSPALGLCVGAKEGVDSHTHPRISSSSAPQVSAVDSVISGKVVAADLNQKYAIHTIVEYTNALVPDMISISNAPYYWGRMDRYEAERLLEEKPEGTFLLRDSAQINYLFSISFRRYKRTLHARIEHLNGMFSFDITDTSVFSASKITDVVANYKDPSKCLFFEPLLSIPLCRGFTFSLQHLCRSVIASNCDYASVGELPLPGQLKKFVREYHYKQPVRVTEHD